jgi:hypothetical protein
VNGNNLRIFTLTPTLSHRERELKEVAINGRSKYFEQIGYLCVGFIVKPSPSPGRFPDNRNR